MALIGARRQHGRFAVGKILPIVLPVILAAAGLFGGTLAAAEEGSSAPPTISSDKVDYAPGETVTLTGAGWQPAEAVHVFVIGADPNDQNWTYEADPVASEAGDFAVQLQLPDWFVANYSVAATGASGSSATTTFTDANFMFDAAVYPYRLSGGSVVFSANGNGTGDHFMWHRQLPAGTYTYTGFTFNGSTSPNFTLSLGATATGTYEVNVGSSGTTAPSTACSGGSCGRYGIWGPNQISFTSGQSLTIAGGGAKQSQAAGGSNAVTVKLFNPSNVQVGSSVSLGTNANGEYSSGTIHTFGTGDPAGTWHVEISSGARYDTNTGFTSSTNISVTVAAADTTPPTISATATKADTTAYTSGTWTNQTVTVHFTCVDTGGSGLAGSCPADQVISAEGTTTSNAPTVSDNAGNISAAANTFEVKIDKTPPTISVSATTEPGGAAYTSGTWTNQKVVVHFTCADTGSGVASCPADQTFDTAGTFSSTAQTATDTAGNISAASGTISVKIDRSNPTVAFSSSASDPVAKDTSKLLPVTASDTGGSGIISVTYTTESGSTLSSPTMTGVTFTSAIADVYQVCAIAHDTAGNSSAQACIYVPVYDPSAGFVTGGGWIDSPPAACTLTALCSDATGKANFGFVSKYLKGASTPTGNTEFNFSAGRFNFSSTSYQVLVVQGSSLAQFRGVGTINGSGAYNFSLTAYDGGSTGDGFRIKITDQSGNIVYDNKRGSSDDLTVANTQTLGGGSIVIHK
jgi:hypothetical protein